MSQETHASNTTYTHPTPHKKLSTCDVGAYAAVNALIPRPLSNSGLARQHLPIPHSSVAALRTTSPVGEGKTIDPAQVSCGTSAAPTRHSHRALTTPTCLTRLQNPASSQTLPLAALARLTQTQNSLAAVRVTQEQEVSAEYGIDNGAPLRPDATPRTKNLQVKINRDAAMCGSNYFSLL